MSYDGQNFLIAEKDSIHSKNKFDLLGREPLSSGYGRWLIFERSEVQIQASYVRWTFFHIDLL